MHEISSWSWDKLYFSLRSCAWFISSISVKIYKRKFNICFSFSVLKYSYCYTYIVFNFSFCFEWPLGLHRRLISLLSGMSHDLTLKETQNFRFCKFWFNLRIKIYLTHLPYSTDLLIFNIIRIYTNFFLFMKFIYLNTLQKLFEFIKKYISIFQWIA